MFVRRSSLDVSWRERLAENCRVIRERIAAACARSGRDPASVRLVAVTKSAAPETIRALPGLGLAELAENRVQALEERSVAAGPGVTWHLVGSLQTNKVRKALALAEWIHSLDRPDLAGALARESGRSGRRPRLLLEVNAGEERTKHGVEPDAAGALLSVILAKHPGLRVEGLMTMAPPFEAPGDARPVFAKLRELRDRLRERTGLPLPELSMGMSQDFEPAVEEGATIVRIGRAFFEGI